MGFRLHVSSLLLAITCDAVLTVVRPTTVDAGAATNVEILDYVLVAAHGVVVIAQAVVIFLMFSNTVWFAAGLVGDLFLFARWAGLFWLLRLFWVQMPWVHRRFIQDLGSRAMDDQEYRFLFVVDYLLAVVSWACLMYTTACMTEKRMYAPYHREDPFALAGAAVFVPPPSVPPSTAGVKAATPSQSQQGLPSAGLPPPVPPPFSTTPGMIASAAH